MLWIIYSTFLFVLCELRIIERIPDVFPDVVVDGENLRGQRFRREIKERLELIADTLSDGDAEGVQVSRDIADRVETV